MTDPLDHSTVVMAADLELATERRPGAVQLHIVVVGGADVASYPLPAAGTVAIGRSPRCDVHVDDKSVSRRHAVLHCGAQLAIEDLGSANGTLVSGEKISAKTPVPVKRGELLQVGRVNLLVQERPGSGGGVARFPGEGRVGRVQIGKLPDAEPRLAAGEAIVIEPVMRSLREMVDRIAGSDLGVLLLGETGVGKEIFAEAIHQASGRGGAFVAVNCATLDDNLLSSELFGHEKGAFTSAVTAKAGLLEAAHDGTVLLDEVGELPAATQAKLLRVIEERKVRRVGSVTSRPINVRFVAATNRDLESDVERGAFRRDLYFRLNGVTIVIPPLRERPLEIEPLARSFAARAARQAGHPAPELAPETLQLLCDYSWPGNIRELKNIVERAVVLCGAGTVQPEHLPGERMRETSVTRARPAASRLHGRRAPDERERITAALARSNGNQTLAAKLLQISRRTLINRLEELGFPRPRKDRS